MKTIILFIYLLFISFASCKKESAFANNPGSEENNRAVGASANELLSSNKYESLKIEIQFMPGYEPDATAVTHLQNFLSGLLNKPSGISVITKQITASSSASLTIDQVKDIEKNNRTAFSTGKQIGVYILYTNGDFTDPQTLGIAYRNTSVVIFGKKVGDNSGALGQPSAAKLEATVLEHELGHLLGLVDIGSIMQTTHKANGNHCNNSNCLMYYTAETTDILGFLVAGNIPSLDTNCLADLTANGGK